MNQLQTILGTFFISDDEYKLVVSQISSGSDFIHVPRLDRYFNKSVVQSVGLPDFIRRKMGVAEEFRICNEGVYAKEAGVWKKYEGKIWKNTSDAVERLAANVYVVKKDESKVENTPEAE